MLNNFIYSEKKSLFEDKLSVNEVPEGAIAFLEDTKEIWTHDHYFGGGGDSRIYIGDTDTDAEEGIIFIDENEDSGIEVYNKAEIDAKLSGISGGQLSVVKLSSTSNSLTAGNWYIHSPGSSAATYTLPSTGSYTATSTNAKVEEFWLELTKGSGSVTFSGGTVKWPNATTPTFTSGKTYQISFTARYTSGSTVVWLAAVSQEYTL